MNSNKPQNSSGFKNLSGKRLLYFVTALVCILMTSAVAIILLNKIVVGGANYNAIKKNTDAIENIAIINSNLYQILNEVRPIMHDTDKGTAITMARLLTLDIDKRFITLQDLIKSSGRKEIVNKVDLTWKEYKKTLMEEIIPASAKGDKLKIAYLTTGIQSQRFNSINKNLSTLTATLRQDIAQAELQATSDKNINFAIIAFLTTLLLCVTAYLQRITSKISDKQTQPGAELTSDLSTEKPADQIDTAATAKSIEQPEAECDMPASVTHVPLTTCQVPEELISNCCDLNNTSANTVTFLSDQETAINDLFEQTGDIIQASRHLAADLAKLASWSTNNQVSAVSLSSADQETALKADQLQTAIEQIHHDVSKATAALKLLHTDISSLQNAACNTASSVVYMDAGIKLLQCNSQDIFAITDTIKLDAETGKRLVEDAINSIYELRSSAQITTEAVERLSLKTRSIGSIISMIDEVAEQTKLLALNATIIATQAGEHGSEFAGVAGEIRQLAEHTSDSTSKVSAIIRDLQKETTLTVDSICKSEANIIRSEQTSKHSALLLENIINGIQQTSTQIQQIADAASVRASESHAIKNEVHDLSKLAENIAISAGEQSALLSELTFTTEQLSETIAFLRSDAHDQSSKSSIIANAAAELNELNNAMQDTGLILFRQNEIVSATMGHIRETSTKAVAAATTTKETAEKLSKQIDIPREDLSSGNN